MIDHPTRRHVPRTAEFDVPGAVLLGLYRVSVIELPLGPGDRTEVSVRQLQRMIHLEITRDDEHGIVRLVVLLVERLEAFDRNALDVALGADRGLAVVVPQIGRRLYPRHEDPGRAVFARLELIANDGHFGVEVLPPDEAVDHPVGFHPQRPFEVSRLGRGQRFIIVRAIDPGRTVEAGPVFLKLLPDVRVIRRAFEHHVLEQVGHPRLAAPLVSRTDEIGHVDGHGRLGRVGEQQKLQPVVVAILGDALDAGNLGAVGMRRRR